MTELEAIKKIIDEHERRIAVLESNKLDKKKLKKYIDGLFGISKRSGKMFAPPTIDDVKVYVKEHNRVWAEGNTPESFVSFYGSKDWMIGKNKMKDWGLALCNKWTVQKEEIEKKELDIRCNCGRLYQPGDKKSYGMCSVCHFEQKKIDIENERAGQ